MAGPAADSAAMKAQEREYKNWMTTWIRESIHDQIQWKAADEDTQKAMDDIASTHMSRWRAETIAWDFNLKNKFPNTRPRPREHEASTEALKLALDLPGVPDLLEAIETMRLKKSAPSATVLKKAAAARASRKKTTVRAAPKKVAPVRAPRKSTRLSTKSPVASTPADSTVSETIVVNFHPAPEPIIHKATEPYFPLSSPKVATPPARMADAPSLKFATPRARMIESNLLTSPIANPADDSEASGPAFSRIFTPPPPWCCPRAPPADLEYDSDATEVPTREYATVPSQNSYSPSASYPMDHNAMSSIPPSRRNRPSRSPSPPLYFSMDSVVDLEQAPDQNEDAASDKYWDSRNSVQSPVPRRQSPAAAFLTGPEVSSIPPSRRNRPSRSPSPPSCLQSCNSEIDFRAPDEPQAASDYLVSMETVRSAGPRRQPPASSLTGPEASSTPFTTEEAPLYGPSFGQNTRPSSQRATSPSLMTMARYINPGDRRNASRISTTPAGSMRVPSPRRPSPSPFLPPRSRHSADVTDILPALTFQSALQSADWMTASDPEFTRRLTDRLESLKNVRPFPEYAEGSAVPSIPRPVRSVEPSKHVAELSPFDPYAVAEARARIDDHFILGSDVNTSDTPALIDVHNGSRAGAATKQKKRVRPSNRRIILSSDEEDEGCYTLPSASLARQPSPPANPPPSQFFPVLKIITSPSPLMKRRKVRFADINEVIPRIWEDVEEESEEIAPAKKSKPKSSAIKPTTHEQDIDDEDEIITKPIKKSKVPKASKPGLKTYSKIKAIEQPAVDDENKIPTKPLKEHKASKLELKKYSRVKAKPKPNNIKGIEVPEGVVIPSGHTIVRRDGWKEGPAPIVKPKKRRIDGEVDTGEVKEAKKRKMNFGATGKGKKDVKNPFLSVDWDSLEEKMREEEEVLKGKGKKIKNMEKEKNKVNDEFAQEEQDQDDDMEG